MVTLDYSFSHSHTYVNTLPICTEQIAFCRISVRCRPLPRTLLVSPLPISSSEAIKGLSPLIHALPSPGIGLGKTQMAQAPIIVKCP